jgi:WD40 repeat protein
MFMDRDWFTCFSVSEECSTIIACTANRRIVFIDFLTGEKTSETKVQHPIQTIQVYLQKEKYFGSAIETLWMGDTGGGILMGTLADFRIDKKFERHAVHTDWITKVEYVPELQAVLSSSLDKTLVMFDCATSTIRKRLYSTDGHVSGILTFAWLPSLRMIVSSGVDRFFVYWNPYTAKVVHRMVGHNGPVRLFALYNRLHMLIAVSDDKILKVWDIRSYKVLQSVGDDIEASRRENIRAISIDEHKCRVLIADAISIKSMLFAQTVQNLRTTTCKTPVVACLFNWVFNTIVTVSTDCAVTVWSADNGGIFTFATQTHA